MEYGVEIIEDWAFAWCSNLKSVTIPNSVTTIKYYAFFRCTNLETIIIPESITQMGHHIFESCESLQTIYCRSNYQPAEWDEYWKSNYGCSASVVWGYTGE